jgi:hypothetical protein
MHIAVGQINWRPGSLALGPKAHLAAGKFCRHRTVSVGHQSGSKVHGQAGRVKEHKIQAERTAITLISRDARVAGFDAPVSGPPGHSPTQGGFKLMLSRFFLRPARLKRTASGAAADIR